MPGRRPLALCLAALLLLGGCGGSAHSALSVAQSWAAAQRAGQASRACDLSSTDSVRGLGGRAGCVRFFAASSLGRNVRVDPSGVTPRRPNVYAIVDSEPGVTRYGMSVRVVTEAGVLRVRFDPPAGISVSLPRITRPAKPVRCPSVPLVFVPSGPFDARAILGLPEARAGAAAALHGCTIRVYGRDGHYSVLTADLRATRVNVSIVHGVVVKIWNVG